MPTARIAAARRRQDAAMWLCGVVFRMLPTTGCLIAGLWVAASGAHAQLALKPSSVRVQMSAATEPGQLDEAWQDLAANGKRSALKKTEPTDSQWSRVQFDAPLRSMHDTAPPGSSPREPSSAFARASQTSWVLYLPALFAGEQYWFNGTPLLGVARTTDQTHVRWQRAALISIPDSLRRDGANVLLVHSRSGSDSLGWRMRNLMLGTAPELAPTFDRRMFWVHNVPQASVVICVVVGLFGCFVWWRRRAEVLTGLFGIAAVLWAMRTMTFVIEVMPAPWWPWWRLLYHTATAGFIVVLAMFAMRFAGWSRPWVDRLLIGYALIGPLMMLFSLGQLDALADLYWTAGLIPIGLAIAGFAGLAWWRQRSGQALALCLALSLGVLAGVHDYLVANAPGLSLSVAFRTWLSHGVFLLHHAANALLLVMVAILTLRFVHALDTVADLNRSLEQRVADREVQLAAQHAQVVQLQREQAVSEERQRIMRDLHDGLGSQMFTALARVERGGVSISQLGQVLRDCIADMRLTFDVTAPDHADLRAALGSFRFRWEQLLRDAGVHSRWDIDESSDDVPLNTGTALQLLRVAQEALTNVLKHAAATQVQVSMRLHDGALTMNIVDDGRGFVADQVDGAAGAGGSGASRGLINMRQRAERIGARIEFESRPGYTRVGLRLALGSAAS